MQNANLDITFEWHDIGLSYFTHDFLVTLTMIPSSRSSFKVKDKYKNHSFRTNGGGGDIRVSQTQLVLNLKLFYHSKSYSVITFYFFWYFSVFVPEKHQNISTDM